MVYRERLLHFDPDAVLDAVTDQTKIIVIANPNNPTGNFMDPDSFVRIAETGIPFIVDEAYVEFAGLQKSQVSLIKKFKNVLVTRTLSKAYGLAGMRFGYALGDKDVIGQISAALLPWNVGTIPMWAALAALEDQEGLQKRVEFNNSEVQYIQDALGDIPGLNIFYSHGNYILFDGGPAGKNGDEMVAYAREKGLILRPQSRMYDSDGFFRLTIGSKDENRMAVEVVKEFFAQ
jgi:histidinol-phosphate aminotransferase